MKEFKFKGKQDNVITTYKWDNIDKDNNIKGIVQIAHGMAEHAKRYDELANFLNKNGYIVYANDHRGHGNSVIDKECFGYLGIKDGFIDMVEDMNFLSDYIKKQHDKLPIYLLGHSMGSFLSQKYIQLYGNKLNGVILCGSNGKPKFEINLGIIIAKLQMKLFGEKRKSYILNKLSFSKYNNEFKPTKTEFDWLSRDEKQVNKYLQDNNCGVVFPCSFYYYLFRGLKRLWKKQDLMCIPKELPVYIISGGKDPVGFSGKGVLNLFNGYKKIGVKNLEYKLYKNARHEIINEINKYEVYEDILKWINKY